MSDKKICLIILDGWGHGPKDESINAILKANTPFVGSLYKSCPNSELMTCGAYVGLPDGQMGNSEVGHLNIGAGRVVHQQLVRINEAFKSGDVNTNPTLIDALSYAKENDKKVHLIGLVSDGGIHAHMDHLKGLVSFFHHQQFTNIFVHAFTDGRDTDPRSGQHFLGELQEFMTERTGTVSTVIGRYYAMDRDLKWDRIKLAYDAMIHGAGDEVDDFQAAFDTSYRDGVTDEFILPMVNKQSKHSGRIEPGDVVININFRTDRGRQLTRALTQESFPGHGMEPLDIKYITLTEYDPTYKNVGVLFPSIDLTNTLGEVMAKHGKTQLRIAETEKYPHVTFFFSGGQETPFPGESRIMAQSPLVKTYDLAPEMSAAEVAQKACDHMVSHSPDLVVLNFANADMVGHTGMFGAVVTAVETVDKYCETVVKHAIEMGYTCLVTADHGNADVEVNQDGSPNTAHTTNPVPLFLIEPEPRIQSISNGKLADLAPTILKLMNIEIPEEMTGTPLVD